MSSCRVPHDSDAARVQVVFGRDLCHEAKTVTNIGKSSGPAAAFIAYAAVFDIPGSDATSSQGSTEVTGMGKIIFVAPEAAVDVDDDRMWRRVFDSAWVSRRAVSTRMGVLIADGQAKIAKLLGSVAVVKPGIRRRRRKREKVFRHRAEL